MKPLLNVTKIVNFIEVTLYKKQTYHETPVESDN